MRGPYRILNSLLAALLLAGCQDSGTAIEGDEAGAAAAAPADAQSRGNDAPAPVSFAYTVIGSAIVGQPVSISLEVSSIVTDQPVTLHYRINDERNLSFPPSQARRVLLPAGGSGPVTQQVTVIPQREGRVFLNVSAELETEGGMLLKSMAIPIDVAGAPARQPAPEDEEVAVPAGER